MEKRPIRVHVFHQDYSLLAQGDPAALEAAAHAVDELMTALARQTPTADSTRLAVLACLHLADRLRSAEMDLAALRGRTRALSDSLEAALDGNETGVNEPG